MNALVGAFNQEKALVGAFSVIVQPVVEPMEHYTALLKVLEKDTAVAGAAVGRHEAAAVAVADIPPDTEADFDTSDDLVIAQMLQKQFDREHDMALAKEERSLNRSADSVFGFGYHTQGFVCVAGLYVGLLFPRQVVLWSVIG